MNNVQPGENNPNTVMVQTTGQGGLIYGLIERACVESHCADQFRLAVLNVKNLKSDYRKAMESAKIDIANTVDKADIIIGFEEIAGETAAPVDNQPAERPADQETSENPAPETTDTPETADAGDTENNGTETDDQKVQDPDDSDADAGSDDDKDDGSEDEEDVDKAVKEALEKIDEEENPEQADQSPAPETVDNATPSDNEQALQDQGQTADDADKKKTAIKAVARALKINDVDNIKTFDVDVNGVKTFFIPVCLRK